MGNPHPSLAKALIRVLDTDSSRYNFATWEGYAGEDGKAVIEFSPAGRGMVLYSGLLVGKGLCCRSDHPQRTRSHVLVAR